MAETKVVEPFLICGFDLGIRQGGFAWVDMGRMCGFGEMIDIHVVGTDECTINDDLLSYQAHYYAMKFKPRFMLTSRIAPERMPKIPGRNKKVELFGFLFIQSVMAMYPHITIHWVVPKSLRPKFGISGISYEDRKRLSAYKVLEIFGLEQFSPMELLFQGCFDVYDALLLAIYSGMYYRTENGGHHLLVKGSTTKKAVMKTRILTFKDLPTNQRPPVVPGALLSLSKTRKKKVRGITKPLVVKKEKKAVKKRKVLKQSLKKKTTKTKTK